MPSEKVGRVGATSAEGDEPDAIAADWLRAAEQHRAFAEQAISEQAKADHRQEAVRYSAMAESRRARAVPGQCPGMTGQQPAKGWRPIAEAPMDGTHIIARRNPEDVGGRGQRTWWGKSSHVPLYGWCIGTDPEDIDLWRPDEWRPRRGKPPRV